MALKTFILNLSLCKKGKSLEIKTAKGKRKNGDHVERN